MLESRKILQLALGVGMLGLAAATAVSFANSGGRTAAPEPPVVAATPGLKGSLPHYAVIAERNLFRPISAPVTAPSPEPPLEESALDVELRGTLSIAKRPVTRTVKAARAGKHRKQHADRTKKRKGRAARGKERRARPSARKPSPSPGSLAILRDVDGEVRTLAVGDGFAGQSAKLVRVEPRRIVIEHAGKLETVTLASDDEDPPARMVDAKCVPLPSVRPLSARPSGAPPPAPAQPGAALGLLQDLLPAGGIESDAEAGIQAYRVSATGAQSAAELGLQEDDRIRALNGVALAAPDLDIRLQTLLAQHTELILTVEDASARRRLVAVPRKSLERFLRDAR